jgi:hypothetical protein
MLAACIISVCVYLIYFSGMYSLHEARTAIVCVSLIIHVLSYGAPFHPRVKAGIIGFITIQSKLRHPRVEITRYACYLYTIIHLHVHIPCSACMHYSTKRYMGACRCDWICIILKGHLCIDCIIHICIRMDVFMRFCLFVQVRTFGAHVLTECRNMYKSIWTFIC